MLDDRRERDAERVQVGEQRRHRRLAAVGFDHGAVLHGLGERHALGADLGQDDGVDRLEVDVADAVGVLGDDGPVVAAGVGDVPGVEAQRDGGGVGEFEEAGGVRRCRRRGRRRAGGTSAGRRTRRAARGRVRSGRRRAVVHCSAVSSAGSSERAGLQVGVHRGQGDQVRGVHRGEQRGDLAALGERLVERVAAAVQGGAGGGAGEGEAAAAELVAQLLGVGGQVAEGAELDGGVAGRGGLVEEAVPGHLLRVVGEPDAPGVGGGAEPQVGQGGRGHGDCRPVVGGQGRVDVLGRGADRDERQRRCGAVRHRTPASLHPVGGGQRVLFAAKPAILSMLVASTNDGPVSTGLPPPMSLPLVSCSHSESTAS